MGTLVLNSQTVLTQTGTNTPVIANTVLAKSFTELDTTASNGATSNADNTTLPLFGCRAFVSWSGRITSSIGGETCCKIDSSGNVSKVVKTATGTYQIYFTIPMPDANYTVMQCLQDGSNNVGPGGQIGVYVAAWQDLRPANKLAGSLLLHYSCLLYTSPSPRDH